MRKIDMLNQLQSEMIEARTHVEDLCRDWGWTLADKATDDELLEELQNQLDMANEELDYYHDVEKDYNNDIELFQKENAKLIDENIALNQRIKELEDELDIVYKENKRHIDRINQLAVEVETKDSTKVLVKESDAMEQSTKAKEDKIAEEHMKYGTRKPNPKKQPVIIHERKKNGFTEGQVSIDGKNYLEFTASNRFDSLVVYGVTDDNIIAKAKDIIINEGYGDIFTGYASTLDEVLYTEDKENNLVAFCEQGVFYGHIDNKYYFVWNPAKDIPTACLINKMNNPNRRLRAMNRSWGPAFEERAEKIMALCKTMKYIDINRIIKEEEMSVSSYAHNNTNEIIVDTNDTVIKTNDNVPMTEDEAADAL